MEAGIVEQVEEWESEPFSGGYGGLHDLADRGFTGAVTTGDTYLFMLNGRAIGVFDLPPAGSPEAAIEVFEDASGTAYEAPHPSLPLLFTLYLSDGETRAQYYTEDTPLEEVDDRLSDGGFTGYIELSENVLSGDYYVVYQAGRSMSAAFVGASNRLYTDEEAFDRAADEVGIYKVVSVDLTVLDIPDPESSSDETPVAGGVAAEEPSPDDTDEPTTEPAEDSVEEPAESDEDTDEASVESATDTSEPAASADPESTADIAADSHAEPSDSEDSPEPSDAGRESVDAVPDSGVESADAAAEPTPTEYDPYGDQSDPEATASQSAADTGTATPQEDVGALEAESQGGDGDLTVRSVPALDPERSSDGTTTAQVSQSGIDARDRRSRTRSGGTTSESQRSTTRPNEEVDSLRSALTDREERIEELEAALAETTDEREELRTERDRLREERDELEATVQKLRQRIDELESAAQEADAGAGAAAATAAGESLTPQEALAGTDLFVRYRSKSEPTLEAIADGAERSAVTSNLQLERHTRFEDADATVRGQPFEVFLENTLAYRFVRWVVEDLPYEIRETGHTAALRDLYDALPQVDRAELQGTVSIETEDGSEDRSFDVVLRDRMGDPLVVANLDTSRQPTDGGPMRSLIEDATVIANGSEGLSGAFFVTSSFFESDALETARNETGTGLLSRDKRKSVVKLSRKRGYHLCLVEARDESFHLTVPEL